MKLSTTILISLFFSAIAIKAQITSDDSEIDYTDEQYDDEHFFDAEDGIGTGNFQYKPSERLQETEKNLSGDLEKFVKDGHVKETLTNTFLNSMNTGVAIDGLAKLKKELQQIFNGPEASWVIGTFGGDLNKIFTSPEGANIINMIASTVHVLLTKAGERNTDESGLGKLLSSTFSLCSSPKMPAIVDKSGELAITIVNKPKAALFTRQYWVEWQKLLSLKDLNKKLNNYFASLSALMKSLYNQKTKTKQ